MKTFLKVFKVNSPFAHASICAIVIGAGSTIAIVADIMWLIGDILTNPHWYHYLVLTGLSIALGVTVASFAWLWTAVKMYIVRHDRKIEASNRFKHRKDVYTHCMASVYDSEEHHTVHIECETPVEKTVAFRLDVLEAKINVKYEE